MMKSKEILNTIMDLASLNDNLQEQRDKLQTMIDDLWDKFMNAWREEQGL